VRCTIRVILQTLNLCRNGILVAFKIDYPIVLLVATTDVTGCNPPIVISAAIPRLIFQQRPIRGALVKIITYHSDDMATTGGGGLTL